MKSTIPCGVVLFHLFLLIWLNPVQGRGLLANLMKQAETLRHGLDLASKVGDIGSQRFDLAFTVVTSRSTIYSSSGSTIAFNTVKTNHGNGFNIGNSRFTAPTAGLYFCPSVTKFKDKTIKGHGRDTKIRKVRTESTIMHLATIASNDV